MGLDRSQVMTKQDQAKALEPLLLLCLASENLIEANSEIDSVEAKQVWWNKCDNFFRSRNVSVLRSVGFSFGEIVPRHLYKKFTKGVPKLPYLFEWWNPWRPNSHIQGYPWSPGISHVVHFRTSNPQRDRPPSLQVPPTVMLYAPSPIRVHHSGCPIL